MKINFCVAFIMAIFISSFNVAIAQNDGSKNVGNNGQRVVCPYCGWVNCGCNVSPAAMARSNSPYYNFILCPDCNYVYYINVNNPKPNPNPKPIKNVLPAKNGVCPYCGAPIPASCLKVKKGGTYPCTAPNPQCPNKKCPNQGNYRHKKHH